MELSRQIGAVTYSDAGKQRIYVFVRGDDGHLYLNYWDGSKWNWADQGTPPDSTVHSTPAAVTYQDPKTGKQRIYAFVLGENGYLCMNYWTGSQWYWAEFDRPEKGLWVRSPAAITYPESGVQQIQVFCGGPNSFWRNYWDGSKKWQWADQGLPPETFIHSTPGVITYLQSGKQLIYAFDLCELSTINKKFLVQDKELFLNYWDGSNWQWADQGLPPGATPGLSWLGVITYPHPVSGTQLIYAFATGHKDNLYVHYWDGSNWHWADQGAPPGVIVQDDPGVLTYQEAGTQRIYVFVKGENGRLYVNYWNGTTWQWSDQGKPQDALVVDIAGAVTYKDPASGKQHMYVFVRGDDGNLYINWWDGSKWQWGDRGRPFGVALYKPIEPATFP